jgi:hypothetical protein
MTGSEGKVSLLDDEAGEGVGAAAGRCGGECDGIDGLGIFPMGDLLGLT